MRLTEQQVIGIIRSSGENDPVFKAFTQILRESLADETEAAFSSGMPDSERQYQCGRAAALFDLIDAIEQMQA